MRGSQDGVEQESSREGEAGASPDWGRGDTTEVGLKVERAKV